MRELTYLFCAALSVSVVMLVINQAINDDNDGNNNHYAQKDTIMIENTDTIRDTIYVSVPDQNAYNIGYFDGNFDAQNGNIIGVDND